MLFVRILQDEIEFEEADLKWVGKSKSNVVYLEPLILKNFLDGNHFPSVAQFCLVHDAKTSIAYDLRVGVGHFLRPVWALSRGGHHRCHLATILA
jgi:hypothetical protein